GQLRGAGPLVDQLSGNLVHNMASLSGYFGSWSRLIPAVVGIGIAFTVVSTSCRVHRGTKCLSGLLLFAALLHLTWWFAFSPTGWYRHLLPAIIYLLVLGALLVGAIDAVSRPLAVATFASCCLSAALILLAW